MSASGNQTVLSTLYLVRLRRDYLWGYDEPTEPWSRQAVPVARAFRNREAAVRYAAERVPTNSNPDRKSVV